MNKTTDKEKIEDIYQEVLIIKDSLNDLCNKLVEQPTLRIGYELGGIHSVILRLLSDVSELR